MAFSPSRVDLDISQVASEMSVTLWNTVDLIRAIRNEQSILTPKEGRVSEDVG